MKRALLALTITLFALVCCFLPVSAATEAPCQQCGSTVTWTGLSSVADDATAIAAGHYIYDYPEDTHTWTARKTVSGKVCILIPEGKTLVGVTQLFTVPKSATLTIQGDGSLVGGGFAEGTTWTSRNGGILQISAGGTVHIYGCSYGVTLADATALKPYNGGLFYNLGSLNIHGGTLTGTAVGGVGSMLFAGPASATTISGGTITGTAPAVCVQGSLTLSGDPQISRIQLRYKSGSPAHGQQLTVKGAFTGTAEVQFDSSVNATLTDGAVIGISDSANLRLGTLTILDSGRNTVPLYLVPTEGVLKLCSEIPAATRKAYCDICRAEVTWQALAEDFSSREEMESGHYYLDFATGSGQWAQKTVMGKVCLDLNGQTLTGTTRAFVVEADSVLNIMGSGTVIGRGCSTKLKLEYRSGGTILVENDGTLNLYGGKLTYEAVDGQNAGNGGILNVAGTLNLYGGTIADGYASNAGGNIFVTTGGALNLYGGTVSGGTTGAAAKSIGCRGRVTLSGNAQVNELYLWPNVADGGPDLSEMLTIEGKYTGSVKLRLASSNGSPGKDIGTSQSADLSQATITTNLSAVPNVAVVGRDLLLTGGDCKCLVMQGTDYIGSYGSFSQAAAACTDPSMRMILLGDVPSANITKAVTVDLNGYDIAAVTGGATLYCMDSQTDDYQIADGIYGTAPVSSQVQGLPQESACAADGYQMLPEETGRVSFHRLTLAVESMSLRPEDTGLYVTCRFAGDDRVKALISRFGVTLEVDGDPSDEKGYCLPVYYDSEEFGNANTSVLVYGILKESLTNEENNLRGQMQLYAKAFAQLENSTVYGAVQNRSLRQQVEGIYDGDKLQQIGADGMLDSMTSPQRLALFQMYVTHKPVLETWQLPQLKATAPTDKESLAKVIADEAILQARREQIVGKMRQMGELLWVADEDIFYKLSTGRTVNIRKGRLYRGMLYSFARTDEQSFLEYAGEPDEKGYYHISGLTNASLNEWGYDARIGTDCGGSVLISYKQIGASVTPTAGPTTMVPYHGFLPVGDYVHQETADHKTGATKDVTAANGTKVMYASYAKTQPGDILNTSTGTGGHSILIVGKHVVYNPDGSIDGDRSYLRTLEQTPGPISNENCGYDPELDQVVYTCFVEKNITFAKAYNGGQLPVNCLELRDASAVPGAPEVTDSLDADSYSYHNLFAGILQTNRMISNVTLTVTDSSGNVQSVKAFAIRTSTDQTHAVNKFYMRNFLTEDPVKMIGSFDPYALAVGQYRCTVEALLSTGDRFTVRDFDFTVTQADKTNPPVFLPEA